MPDDGAARACSLWGPRSAVAYVDARLASRPIAVLPIPSRCPPWKLMYGAVGTGLSVYIRAADPA